MVRSVRKIREGDKSPVTKNKSGSDERKRKHLMGKDEMNLAEFPFATLARRDQREADERHILTVQYRSVGPDGQDKFHVWTAEGSPGVGLPNEFGERVLVALLAITAQQDFCARKITFSVYQILKIMRLGTRKSDYQQVEKALKQLKGVTIFTEDAFWNHGKKTRTTNLKGFNILDYFWLRYIEDSETITEDSSVGGYIIWGIEFWDNFQAGYIKNLDIDFFFSLKSAIARRLYRYLDKQFYNHSTYERDIFELAARLGMAKYSKPTHIVRKLKPGIEELVERGYLDKWKVKKVPGRHKKFYTRLWFEKADPSLGGTSTLESEPGLGLNQPQFQHQTDSQAALLEVWHQRYGTTEKELTLWPQVLKELEMQMTEATFNTHLIDSVLLSLRDNEALIGVKSQLTKEWIEGRLFTIIERTLANHLDGQSVTINCVDLDQELAQQSSS
jgi:hypothetical protein